VNRYIENQAPWALAKSKAPEDKAKLEKILIHCHESLRIASLMLLPFIPATAEKALAYLGVPEDFKKTTLASTALWGKGVKEVKITKGSPLFPRLEWKTEGAPAP
jgi:methionyl-tRNA synthetase